MNDYFKVPTKPRILGNFVLYAFKKNLIWATFKKVFIPLQFWWLLNYSVSTRNIVRLQIHQGNNIYDIIILQLLHMMFYYENSRMASFPTQKLVSLDFKCPIFKNYNHFCYRYLDLQLYHLREGHWGKILIYSIWLRFFIFFLMLDL